MKKFPIFLVIGLAILVGCNKNAPDGPSLQNESSSMLLDLADSVAYFHNLVCEEYLSRNVNTKSAVSIETPLDENYIKEHIALPFTKEIVNCVDIVLLRNGIDIGDIPTQDFENIFNLVYPFVTELICSGKSATEVINDQLKSYFTSEQIEEIQSVLDSDFISYSSTKCADSEYLEFLYKIGNSSKEFWSSYNTKSRINLASYGADGIGGALGLVCGMSGIAGWCCLAVSTCWSMAVDKWEPSVPEPTNCD